MPDRLWGPSPRARGADLPGGALGEAGGTIPACAGSSRTASRTGPARWDHPRVRGEQISAVGFDSLTVGPSPRARGADNVVEFGRSVAGTIPACAGSSAGRGRCGRPGWDHPRVRGEQAAATRWPANVPGPSPRARGAATTVTVAMPNAGTIPACAGSSYSADRYSQSRRDHPRVRGEQGPVEGRSGLAQGPSPRARGADDGSDGRVEMKGTIPACAGSRRAGCRPSDPDRDHPRVRGEQRDPDGTTWLATGPSPRARGAGVHAAGGEREPGTIPACAGSRDPLARWWSRKRDHPRVRGEQGGQDNGVFPLWGPSPRARGAGRWPPEGGHLSGDHPRVRGEQTS